MATIKNVALIGGSGAIGAPILSALLSSGKFNVTVITRQDSKSTFPSTLKVVRADLATVDSLTAAFQGQDAVVSAVGAHGLAGQTVIVDAAVAAGVKRIIPSEFGSDINNALTKMLLVHGSKIAIRKHIEEKIKAGSDITYTYINNGPFLDWGLNREFLLKWKEGKPSIYDGGDQLISVTTLESVATSVVGVLTHYEETKNRSIYIHDIAISQNRLIELAKKVAPGKKWEPVYVNTADIKKEADEKAAKGEITEQVIYAYLFVGIFGEGYGAHFQKVDNDLVGVTGKTEADVEDIWKKLLL